MKKNNNLENISETEWEKFFQTLQQNIGPNTFNETKAIKTFDIKNISCNNKTIKKAIKIFANDDNQDKYIKIIKLANTNIKNWIEFDFVIARRKRYSLISFITSIIQKVQHSSYNLEQNQEAIFAIMEERFKEKNFPPEIIKNLYIGKLQNIIAILSQIEDMANNDGNKKIHNNTKNNISQFSI